MPQNIIKLSQREDRIINMVKAMKGMKNKNQALGFIIQKYAHHFLPEALKPIENPKRQSAKRHVKDLEELRKGIRE